MISPRLTALLLVALGHFPNLDDCQQKNPAAVKKQKNDSATIGIVVASQSKVDWEDRYQQLLKSDPSVKEKLRRGETTKQEIMKWLKSNGDSNGDLAKPIDPIWEKRFQELLKSEPSIRLKLETGEATKSDIIEYLKQATDDDKKKAEMKSYTDGNDCGNSTAPGYHSIVIDDEKREYLLHVPKSYDSARAYPLVINFHGFGDCAKNYSESIGVTLGFNKTASENGFLVAYPQAILREKGARYWEPGDDGTKSIRQNDVYFIKKMIADSDKQYNIDLKRVYAIGYSNGGMMAYDLACSATDVVAAVGIMSGTMLGDIPKGLKQRTPIIHFHGVRDEVLPYRGNEFYKPIPSLVEAWRTHHNISKSAGQKKTHNEGAVTSLRYSPAGQSAVVTFYTVKSEYNKPGGHVWFSDKIDGSHPNQILWDFMASHQRHD